MDEEIILSAADKMAETVANMHFRNNGLMEGQVPELQWAGYYDMVRDKILDVASKYSE